MDSWGFDVMPSRKQIFPLFWLRRSREKKAIFELIHSKSSLAFFSDGLIRSEKVSGQGHFISTMSTLACTASAAPTKLKICDKGSRVTANGTRVSTRISTTIEGHDENDIIFGQLPIRTPTDLLQSIPEWWGNREL
jgi:hypothetical protein